MAPLVLSAPLTLSTPPAMSLRAQQFPSSCYVCEKIWLMEADVYDGGLYVLSSHERVHSQRRITGVPLLHEKHFTPA